MNEAIRSLTVALRRTVAAVGWALCAATVGTSHPVAQRLDAFDADTDDIERGPHGGQG